MMGYSAADVACHRWHAHSPRWPDTAAEAPKKDRTEVLVVRSSSSSSTTTSSSSSSCSSSNSSSGVDGVTNTLIGKDHAGGRRSCWSHMVGGIMLAVEDSKVFKIMISG